MLLKVSAKLRKYFIQLEINHYIDQKMTYHYPRKHKMQLNDHDYKSFVSKNINLLLKIICYREMLEQSSVELERTIGELQERYDGVDEEGTRK